MTHSLVAEVHRIVLIPGDGIGPEVIYSDADVLRILLPDTRFTEAEAGFGAYERHGTPLPDAMLAACRAVDAILFGAVTPPDLPRANARLSTPHTGPRRHRNDQPCLSRRFFRPVKRNHASLRIVRMFAMTVRHRLSTVSRPQLALSTPLHSVVPCGHEAQMSNTHRSSGVAFVLGACHHVISYRHEQRRLPLMHARSSHRLWRRNRATLRIIKG
jgi:hypothetical protein